MHPNSKFSSVYKLDFANFTKNLIPTFQRNRFQFRNNKGDFCEMKGKNLHKNFTFSRELRLNMFGISVFSHLVGPLEYKVGKQNKIGWG